MLAARALKSTPREARLIWLDADKPHWRTTFRANGTHSGCHRTIGKMDHRSLRCPRPFIDRKTSSIAVGLRLISITCFKL